MAFLALRGLWGIQSEIPEDFYLSQFEGADMVNCKQTSFDLAVFGGDEANFREKKDYVLVDVKF